MINIDFILINVVILSFIPYSSSLAICYRVLLNLYFLQLIIDPLDCSFSKNELY